jgi:hypothetical protein
MRQIVVVPAKKPKSRKRRRPRRLRRRMSSAMRARMHDQWQWRQLFEIALQGLLAGGKTGHKIAVARAAEVTDDALRIISERYPETDDV